jgi:predicted NAD/FAD-binding protein
MLCTPPFPLKSQARVAVIGAGVSGLSMAFHLGRETNWDVTVIEGRTRIGGHAHTHQLEFLDEPSFPVDTGFIVFNDRNYPHFRRLISELEIDATATDMSFSVSLPGPKGRGAFEYSGAGINGLFAQRSNALRPSFWRLLRDIDRFNRAGRATLRGGDFEDEPVGEWLSRRSFSAEFINRYLLPMAGAVWSASPQKIRAFPISSLFHFLDNHGLLEWNNRPQWLSIRGGSEVYVRQLVKACRATFKVGSEVTSILRQDKGVRVDLADGESDQYDAVVLACHADDALKLLSDSDPLESEILGSFEYSTNTTYLHSDPSLMPLRRQAWACWNYVGSGSSEDDPIAVSYWMNALQQLNTKRLMVVTLNPDKTPQDVHKEVTYRHPQFDMKARQAQHRRDELQGHRNAWYAGAHWRWGFHEDGVVSAVTACRSMGVPVPLLDEVES